MEQHLASEVVTFLGDQDMRVKKHSTIKGPTLEVLAASSTLVDLNIQIWVLI